MTECPEPKGDRPPGSNACNGQAFIWLRYGFALGNNSTGDLWLQNGNGVAMHPTAKRQGVMLSLGGDAVVIQMNQ